MTPSEDEFVEAFERIDAEFGNGGPPPGGVSAADAARAAYAAHAADDGEDGVEDDVETDEDDDMDAAAKARLAAALAEIDARFGRPPAEQVSAFAEAHQTLQATLSRIDTP